MVQHLCSLEMEEYMEDLFKMKQEGVKYICYPYPTEQNNNIDYRFRKNKRWGNYEW